MSAPPSRTPPPVAKPKLYTTREPSLFESATIPYAGRLARQLSYQTGNVVIGADALFPYAIEPEYEEGELNYFLLACNDPLIAVFCLIYDQENRPQSINDITMEDVAVLGRGMTISEALSTLPDGFGGEVARDIGGRRDPMMPWIQRYKHTFSRSDMVYNNVKGTNDDKWIVLVYSPEVPIRYSRISFSVRNTSFESRVIHKMIVNRTKFVDAPPGGTRKEIQDSKNAQKKAIMEIA